MRPLVHSFCIGLVLALASIAGAPAQSPRPDGCRPQGAGTARVGAVIDGRSFRIEGGGEIRLPGIEVAFLPRAGETGAAAEAGLAARAALAEILREETIELRQTVPAADRYGRMLADAYVGQGDSQKSAAHVMLAEGFARVSAQAGACAAEFLALERAAREARLGLWGQGAYAVLRADDVSGLMLARGRFALVEGKVASVRRAGARST
jgi:endonuclease YncB( thermonuclease family)